MMNAKIRKVNGSEVLEVQVPVNKEPSKSGKTTLVASTHGNKATQIQIDGFNLIVSVNAYIPKQAASDNNS